MNTYKLALDLDKTKKFTSYQSVVLRQGELQGCVIEATITDHEGKIDTDGLTPYLVAKMPSGSYYRQSGEFLDGVAVVAVDEQYFASETGKALMAYFELRDDGNEVIATTIDFAMRTMPNATGDGEIAEPYDSAIEDALAEIGEAVDAANELIDGFYASLAVLTDEDVDALFE